MMQVVAQREAINARSSRRQACATARCSTTLGTASDEPAQSRERQAAHPPRHVDHRRESPAQPEQQPEARCRRACAAVLRKPAAAASQCAVARARQLDARPDDRMRKHADQPAEAAGQHQISQFHQASAAERLLQSPASELLDFIVRVECMCSETAQRAFGACSASCMSRARYTRWPRSTSRSRDVAIASRCPAHGSQDAGPQAGRAGVSISMPGSCCSRRRA